jgi:hypothetical protein
MAAKTRIGECRRVFVCRGIGNLGVDVALCYSESDKDSGIAIWNGGFSRFFGYERNRLKPQVQKII